MGNKKTYSTGEVIEALGLRSRQRLNHLLHGYKSKGSEMAALLTEDEDYYYQRARIKITEAGYKKIKKYKAAREKAQRRKEKK